MNLSALGDWMLARLQESSTVAGLVAAGTILLGHTVAPEYTQAIATIAGIFASAVCVATAQKPKQ